MTVTATSGAFSDTVDLVLIVTSAVPSFTIGISPATRTAVPNQTVSYIVAVSGIDSFTQPVTLEALGLSKDITSSWSINPVAPGSFSILTLSIPDRPSFGSHLFQVVGAAETQVTAKSVGLTIDYPFKNCLPIVLNK